MPPLLTYQIPILKEDTYETRKAAQSLIDQADEDLFCALGCRRRNPHEPLNEICYLLHQSLEKWIKVAHQMSFGRYPHSHDLKELLLPFLKSNDSNNNDQKTTAETLDLSSVLRELNAEMILTDKNYPDRVRYRMKIEGKFSLNAHADILLQAVFLARRLIKCWLPTREKEEV